MRKGKGSIDGEVGKMRFNEQLRGQSHLVHPRAKKRLRAAREESGSASPWLKRRGA